MEYFLNIYRKSFVIESGCVFWEVGTEFINTAK
jgi:hypothetical protein